MSTKSPIPDKAQFRGDILDRQFSVHYDPITGMYSYDYADLTPEILSQLGGLKFYRVSSPKLADVEAEVSKLRKPTAAASTATATKAVATEAVNEKPASITVPGKGGPSSKPSNSGASFPPESPFINASGAAVPLPPILPPHRLVDLTDEALSEYLERYRAAGVIDEAAIPAVVQDVQERRRERNANSAAAAEEAKEREAQAEREWEEFRAEKAASPDSKPLTERGKQDAEEYKKAMVILTPLIHKRWDGQPFEEEDEENEQKGIRIIQRMDQGQFVRPAQILLAKYKGKNESTIPEGEKETYAFAKVLVENVRRLEELEKKEELTEEEKAEQQELEEYFNTIRIGELKFPELLQDMYKKEHYEYTRAAKDYLVSLPKEEQDAAFLPDLRFFDEFVKTFADSLGVDENAPATPRPEAEEGKEGEGKEGEEGEGKEAEEENAAVGGRYAKQATRKHKQKHTQRRNRTKKH